MLVPLSIAITAILICSGLALFSGICLGTAWRDIPQNDFRPQVVAYADMVRQFDEPRLIDWTPTTRQRFRYQQEASRQLLAAQRTA